MGEHTGKQLVYLTQKQGRDTHSERNGMGILSIEEERSKSDPRRRYTPREQCGALSKTERSMEVM